MSEAALCSDKMRKFGVHGAGFMMDSMATVKLAQARKESADAGALAGSDAAPKAAAKPSPDREAMRAQIEERIKAEREKQAKAEAERQAERSAELERRAEVARAARPADDPASQLTRTQILEILAETARVQGVVQQEISVLARKLAEGEKGEKGEKKSKKRSVKPLSFVDGHKKIEELGLPKEPLEEHGLTENAFQKVLLMYEEDDEVMMAAQRLLHPAGKGDPQRARSITMDKIIEIHQFMVVEMQKVLSEFLSHPQELRRSFTGKGCETTAELLVSIAVEQQLAVRCEDVEQAVIVYEEQLQGHPEFTRCTEQLASMMQHLIGAAQPRVEKSEFLRILAHMGETSKMGKVFAKKLYDDYRAKTCSVGEAYRRFEKFSEEVGQLGEAADLPDMNSVEMQLCYDEYGHDPEVQKEWEDSGAESNAIMQSMMMGTPGPTRGANAPEAERKPPGKKSKPSEIVEMQELMVDELKRTTDAAAAHLEGANGCSWRAEVAVQMVQALASAAVERRYGIAPEDMTIAGFQHAAALQKNERFVRATEKQQEILMRIGGICGDPSARAALGMPGGGAEAE